ncbi:RNA 2',3'-cyclic phosphodiesterase [Nocardioides marmoraquaticus]
MTRMFVALLPPDDVLEDLEELVAPRREARVEGRPLRWTPAEQWHVTLAFMASVPDRALDELLDRLGAAAERTQPFDVWLTGGGAFPDVASGRVLWTGVEPAAELEALSVRARNAAVASGVEVDGQRFRPHLTLARTNRPTELTRWVRVLEPYRSPVWPAGRLALVASYLGEGRRGGPRYEVVAEAKLGPTD